MTMILTSKISNDKYTEYVYDKYDIQNREKTIVNVPDFPCSQIERFDWNIGLIIGRSGSGKSSILSQIRKNMVVASLPTINNNLSLVSQFSNLKEEDVCELLCGIGLSSVPTWLRTPNIISNGERARFDIVSQIANAKDGEIIVIDEYTSVVNRDVAKSMSFSLQRYIRSKSLRVILASCHYDIILWLQPNWIFNLNKQVDGTCEIERLIYENENDYKQIKKLRDCEILTDEREVR